MAWRHTGHKPLSEPAPAQGFTQSEKVVKQNCVMNFTVQDQTFTRTFRLMLLKLWSQWNSADHVGQGQKVNQKG